MQLGELKSLRNVYGAAHHDRLAAYDEMVTAIPGSCAAVRRAAGLPTCGGSATVILARCDRVSWAKSPIYFHVQKFRSTS
jgi:hypothetical protein